MVCTGCYKDVVRYHRRIRPEEVEEVLSLGHFEHDSAAVVASDLAIRALKGDPSLFNLTDEMLRDLLPIFGDDVVSGLDKKLPEALREGIIREMGRLAG
jgi:hypothetical protein